VARNPGPFAAIPGARSRDQDLERTQSHRLLGLSTRAEGYSGPVADDPALIIQVPRGSAIERQLHDRPPASVRTDDVVVQTGPTDARGVLEEMAGDVVLALPAPQELGRHPAEVRRVLDQSGSGTAPLVVVIQAGEELLEEEAAPLVDAARSAHRPVILRIIRPSER